MAARVYAFGWHVQLQIDGRELPEHDAMLRRLPGTLVIDHVGKYLEPVMPDHPAFRCLLGLVGTGRSGSSCPRPTRPRSRPAALRRRRRAAKALIRAAPERMLWASNWPHPGQSGERYPEDVLLLDLLLDWAPDDATRDRILAENPAALYGF